MGDFPIDVDPIPINGNILVRLDSNAKTSSGGIIIPDTVVNRPIKGRVEEVSIGYFDSGVWMDHQVSVGDTVVFNWKEGYDLVLSDGTQDVEFRILHEKHVVAILRGV